jgi:hypothetical protein
MDETARILDAEAATELHIALAESKAMQFALRPVGDLSFHIADKLYTFEPSLARAQDMPFLLMLMVSLLAQGNIGPLGVKDYVDEHKLWHCFKER